MMNIAPSKPLSIPMPGVSFGSSQREQKGTAAKKRILVVDDNVVFLKAMSYKLRDCGYEVLTAVDGASAVNTVRRLIPDLILLDLNFPPDVAHGGGVGWNGLLILNWLRRMNEAQHVPVIAITGGDVNKFKAECDAAGVLDVFEKPADNDLLMSAIRRALHEEEPEKKQVVPPAVPAKRVLFVDDENDWRYMSTLYLSECGYEVFTAENPAQAVKEAARVRPDAIVLDLNLGGDDGTTLLNVLPATHPTVPILIYTGRDLTNAEMAELIGAGAYECLRKGTMEELLTAVRNAVNEPREDKPTCPSPDDVGAPTDIRSVLIVEDDVAFGDMLRTFLESHPFCVTRVTDGAEGLRQLTASDFDIILSDMALPNLTGDQLYLAIEQIKPHLCSRFIFMTGHHADPQSDNFIRRVHGLMLWKPFHLGDLLTAAETIRKKNAGKTRVVEPGG
jgi:CheY-like chemotaxis protein